MQERIDQYTLGQRAKQSAKDALPALPTVNTYDSWQEYLDHLEKFDVAGYACEDADSWDWTTYNHKAMQLVSNVKPSALDNAEEMLADCGGLEETFEQNGIYGIACQIAYWIVQQAVYDATYDLQQELIEFAQNQLDNMGE